ncbi:MAG: sensor histidine kinase [Butyricicoccus sp.]
MDSVTRILCKKYTDLSEKEIDYIESYEKLLPALANAEEADVFIDCRTATGRSAIVVSEAKPQTVPSNYSTPILGMLIRWKDEPAVDRSFRLGVATIGVRAVSMPEDRKIVQTVEPICFEGRLIGVLIYEKPAADMEMLPEPPEHRIGEVEHELNWDILSQYLDDAVILFDERDRVCGYNRAASALYRNMGYVSSLMGMPATNIQPTALSNWDGKRYEAFVINRMLQYRKILLNTDKVHSALIIRDISALRQAEQEIKMQDVAYRELRHRMKNHLNMIANLSCHRGYAIRSVEEAQTVLQDTANRLRSIAATLTETAQVSLSKVSLLHILEQIQEYTMQTLLAPSRGVNVQVSGEDIEVSGDCGASVALVVNELVQNSIKHAFPDGKKGVISIVLAQEPPVCKITVEDTGIGFSADDKTHQGIGLRLASSVVQEKLMGELSIEQTDTGTKITFDFLEK